MQKICYFFSMTVIHSTVAPQVAQVFQQLPFEDLGAIRPWLEARGYEIRYTRFLEGDTPPDPASYGLLVALGGFMGVHDEAEYPWLRTEKAALTAAMRAGVPTVGICLGAQLIAHCLGAEVARNPEREIGFFPVEWEGFPGAATLPVFHWHGDTFAIPEGARRIGSSAACKNQGFWKPGVLGLQCHLEATPQSVDALVRNCAAELAPGMPFVQSAAAMQGVPEATFERMHQFLNDMLDRFFLNSKEPVNQELP
jgi:GMP synthase-like glutamine amidotransferase